MVLADFTIFDSQDICFWVNALIYNVIVSQIHISKAKFFESAIHKSNLWFDSHESIYNLKLSPLDSILNTSGSALRRFHRIVSQVIGSFLKDRLIT